MYPNALVSLGLISSDVRMDSASAMSVNRSEVVILRTRMGAVSSWESVEEARRTRTAVNANDCNYWHDKPSDSVSPLKASTCTCVWARRISSWQIRFAKSLMLSLAEGLDKLDGVRRIQLAGGTAHNVIGRVTYAFGSSEAIIYWKLGQSSINTTAYKRRGVPGNPSFRISGRCRLLTSATSKSVYITRGWSCWTAHTGNRNVNLFFLIFRCCHDSWKQSRARALTG